MKTHVLAIAAGLLLAGCSTPYASPVEVTRFVGEAPAALGRGPIAVRAGPGDQSGLAERTAFEAAVADQLRRVGYTVAGGDASQVAEIWVERLVARAEGRRSPVSVGLGGQTGSYGSGVGVGLGINLGGGGRGETIDSELRVVIRPAGGGQAVWEGRARFSATPDSEFAATAASADRLARALFDGFPGRSGETIEVK